MKISAIIVVIALLASVVGYLALDRHDKTVSQEKNAAFDQNFNK